MDRHCAIRKLRLLGSLVVGLIAGCSNAEKLPTSSFSGPAGLVAAGTDHARVFVANSGFDAVQVVDLDPQLPNIDMAMAPAKFFPLFIPTGPNPTDLAATPDGAYVFVLDTLLGAVRMIDATTLNLVPIADAIDDFSVVLAPIDSLFDTMVASQSTCSAAGVPGGRCVGRIYLGSQALGQLAIVDAVAAADSTLSLHSRGWVPAAGVPGRIAVAAIEGGDRLFVTDLASANVNQIDVVNGQAHMAAQVDLGERGGVLSVSADGNYLVVGRPTLQDVVVYPLTASGLGAAPAPLDLQPVFTPAPLCLETCAAPGNACAGAHPADLELCSDGNTIGFASAAAQRYAAMYLGAIPSQITPVASAAVQVQNNCLAAGAPQAYQEAMAIATIDGSIYFLGLVDNTGAFSPRLLTQDQCAAPALSALKNVAAPSAYLAACPNDTIKRNRAVCVADNTGAAGVVTLLPGNLRQQPAPFTPTSVQMRLDWEGVVLDGASAAGSIDAQDATLFTSVGVDFTGAVQVGDILRLSVNSSSSKLNAACTQALAALQTSCIAERNIVAISSEGSQLTLDTALPRSCFADPDALTYTVRAGHAFLVGTVANGMWQQLPPARVAPGQAFGMGASQNSGINYVAFTVQALTQDPSPNGCAIYDDTGKLISTVQSKLLARNAPLDFFINDPFTPAQWGRALDATQTGTAAAGRVPGGMVMAPAPFSALLVSYTGSNGVYVMRPTQPTDPMLVNNIGYVRILN